MGVRTQEEKEEEEEPGTAPAPAPCRGGRASVGARRGGTNSWPRRADNHDFRRATFSRETHPSLSMLLYCLGKAVSAEETSSERVQEDTQGETSCCGDIHWM